MAIKPSDDEIYEFMFSTLSYFGKLSEELKAAIRSRTEIRRFWKNDVLAKAGVVCTRCYFSYSGYVKGFKKIDGEQRVQWFMGEKSIIIRPESFHDRVPSNGGIIAIEDMVTVELVYEDFAWLVENYPEFRKINELAVLHYYKLSEERAEMKDRTAEKNLEKLLIDHPNIFEVAGLEDIASYLGIDRKTLNRIRKKR